MKKFTLIIILLQVFLVKAQVGIGTNSPEATLDIKAQSANNTTDIEGVLIPRVSKNKAYKMATAKLKESTMIYVDNTTDYTGTDNKVKQIKDKGFYFWDGSKWVTIYKNIYNSDGEINEDRDINLDGNDLKFKDGEVIFKSAMVGIETDYKIPLKVQGNHSDGSRIRISSTPGLNTDLVTTKQGDFKIESNNKNRLIIKKDAGIGMGTNSPEATLDIKAQSADNTNDIEGLLVPRVSKDKAYKMAMNGTKLKESTMIYVNNTSSSVNNPRINKITKKGYYFWRDNEWTAEWNTDSRNIFNSNGTISENRTVTLSSNRKLNFEGGQVIVKENSYSPLLINTTNSGGGGLAVYPDDWSKRIEFNTTKDGSVRIWAGDNHMFIKRNNGYVGFGTTDPRQKLDVRGNTTINGNLGIGKTNPSARLDVNGNTKINGNIEVTSSIKQTSDRKFKERIRPLGGGEGMSYISALNPVTYFWNEMGVERGGDKDIQQIGFIAQEVEEILPEAVGTDSEGNKSVNYIQVIPILTKAVQELKAENEELKQQLRELVKKVALIENAKN